MWKKLFFAPKGRSDVTHGREVGGKYQTIELPLVLLFVADLTQRPNPKPLGERSPVRIDKDTFDAVMASHALSLAIEIAKEGGTRSITLSFRTLADMEPEALVAQAPELAGRLDAVLLQPRFRALESTWRGLRLAVDRIDFRDNVVVEILDCSKSDLHDDLEDAATPAESGFHALLDRAEDEALRLRPIAAVLADYEFNQTPVDVSLLRLCASVAELSNAPFIAAASPVFFGIESFSAPLPADPMEHLDRPFFRNFRGFCDQERACYTALLLPRVLLRPPYSAEPPRDDPAKLCWGSPIYPFATRLVDAFSRHRFCLDITGPEGGTVKDLPTRRRAAGAPISMDGSVEAAFSEQLVEDLSNWGLSALASRPESGEAVFLTARSVKTLVAYSLTDANRPSPEDEAGARLLAELPWLLFACRFLHYLRFVYHFEGLATAPRDTVERELDMWLGQWISDGDVVSPIVATRRPLRRGIVKVTEPEGGAAHFDLELQVRPHFRPEKQPYCTLRVRTRLPRKPVNSPSP